MCDTDRGQQSAIAPLRVLPNVAIDPPSIFLASLLQNQNDGFSCTVREISRTSRPVPRFSLLPSSKLSVAFESQSSGVVADAPEYSYLDRTYRVTAHNTGLGVSSERLDVCSENDKPVISAAVVWNATKFVSTTPERVVLGTVPVRVFLRCPDENVEFVSIDKCPADLKAVISSTRELTISPSRKHDQQATTQSQLDSVVVVSTSTKSRDTVSIPVIRYIPSAKKE